MRLVVDGLGVLACVTGGNVGFSKLNHVGEEVLEEESLQGLLLPKVSGVRGVVGTPQHGHLSRIRVWDVDAILEEHVPLVGEAEVLEALKERGWARCVWVPKGW